MPRVNGERRSLCAWCELVVVSLYPGQWSHTTTRDAAGAEHLGEHADDDHPPRPIRFLTKEMFDA